MNWKKYTVDLGDVKENSKRIFYYESEEALNIASTRAGCSGCTTIGAYEGNKLKVTFHAGKIPIHMKVSPGHQPVVKSILVTLTDGTVEALYYTAKIVKK